MSRSLVALAAAVAFSVGLVPIVSAEEGLQPPDKVIEFTLLDPGQEPQHDLVYAWTEGQTESLTLEMWADTTTFLDEVVMEQHPAIPFRLSATLGVERVDADGTALIEVAVDLVELVEPAADEAARDLLADLQTLVGVRVREEHDTKGYVLASEVIDSIEDPSQLHVTRAQALSVLEGLPIQLPLDPIGVGGTWQEIVTTTDADAPNGSETYTKRLTGVEPDGAFWIELPSTVEIPPQEMPGDEFGVAEPVVASGGGTVSMYSRVDPASVLPAWTSQRHGRVDLEVPLGDGVVFGRELSQGIRGVPGDWDAPGWPALPVMPVESETSTAAQPTLEGRSAAIDVVVLDPGLEPRAELRYRFAEGQVEHTAMVMRMGFRSKDEGVWTDWLGMPPTEVAATTTVTAVRDDGTYEVEMIFTDVGVPAGSAQLPPEAMEELEAQMSGIIGLRQALHLDDRGRILAAETALPAGASMETMQPAQLDALTQEFIDPLPEEAVGVGAVWEVGRQTSDAMGFPASGSNTHTLRRIAADGRLELEGEMHLTAEPGPMTIPDMAFLDATIDRFTTDGDFEKIIDLGLVNPVAGGSIAISDYAFSIVLGDAAEVTEMQMSAEFETRLVDTERG